MCLLLILFTSMPRPLKCKIIDICLEHDEFFPNIETNNVIEISWEELQAIKLKDLDNHGCILGAKKMWISKSTFANIYNQAHKKISKALINGYKIKFKC